MRKAFLPDARCKELVNKYIDNHITDAEKKEFHHILAEYTYICLEKKYQQSCSSDASQDIVLKIFEQLPKILQTYPRQSKVLFKTWYDKILRNYVYDYFHNYPDIHKFVLHLREDITYPVSLSKENSAQLWSEFPKEEQAIMLLLCDPYLIEVEHLYQLNQLMRNDIQSTLKLYGKTLLIYSNIYEQRNILIQKQNKIDSRLLFWEMHKKKSFYSLELIEQKIQRLINQRYKLLLHLGKLDKKIFMQVILLFSSYQQAYQIIKKIYKKIQNLKMVNNNG